MKPHYPSTDEKWQLYILSDIRRSRNDTGCFLGKHGTAHLADNQWRQHPSMIETFYPIYPGYISSNEGPRAADEAIAALAKKLALVNV